MPEIQLPERRTMKPFYAFAEIGASIFVPSALTSRSDFLNETGDQVAVAAVRSELVTMGSDPIAFPMTSDPRIPFLNVQFIVFAP